MKIIIPPPPRFRPAPIKRCHFKRLHQSSFFAFVLCLSLAEMINPDRLERSVRPSLFLHRLMVKCQRLVYGSLYCRWWCWWSFFVLSLSLSQLMTRCGVGWVGLGWVVAEKKTIIRTVSEVVVVTPHNLDAISEERRRAFLIIIQWKLKKKWKKRRQKEHNKKVSCYVKVVFSVRDFLRALEIPLAK